MRDPLTTYPVYPSDTPVKEQDDDPPEQQTEEDTEENWRKFRPQARIIRALHELDCVGFIRRTNRRADHVMRTMPSS
ncbi:hypothetical protein EDD15DRAFT_2261957, partial [Pisolithus albus]